MKPWLNDNCEHLRAYHEYYPVPVAALLWCGVPPEDLEDALSEMQPHPHIRGVYTHPRIPCFEPRCRVIHCAIEANTLPASRENGKVTDGHIAPERRHVSRAALKEWIAKEHPNDKPAFLFDDIERKTHNAISADAFRALQADRDALRTQLQKAQSDNENLGYQVAALQKQITVLEAKDKAGTEPSERSEKTYLNIIGGLLALMLGKSPTGKPQSVFESQSAVISALLGYYGHVKGMGDSNLEKTLAQANKTLKDSLIPGG